MGLWLRIALLLPVAALLGCGAGNSSGSGSAPVTYNLSGNWGAYADPSRFTGALQISNGLVAGTMSMVVYSTGAACQIQSTTATVTGTMDASGDLTINVPLGGSNGTAIITATIPANPQTLVNGSYEIIGGACVTPPTPVTVAQYAPVNGTYTGTLNLSEQINPPATDAVTVTGVLTQSSTPTVYDSEYGYVLSGTFAYVSATCSTYQAPVTQGTDAGGSIIIASPYGYGSGYADPTASTITIYNIAFPGCGDNLLTGTLTRQ